MVEVFSLFVRVVDGRIRFELIPEGDFVNVAAVQLCATYHKARLSLKLLAVLNDPTSPVLSGSPTFNGPVAKRR
jgi:hypothetical protein